MPIINSMRNILLLLIFSNFLLVAQDQQYPAINGQYRNFFLSMNEEQCREALIGDSYFIYDGIESPSLLRESQEVLIDSQGRSYIQRGWFQFNGDQLVLMTFQLNQDKLDYYGLFSQLQKKYGPPVDLDPQQAIWRNEEAGVEMILTKPLEIRFRDINFLQGLIDEGRAAESYEELLRQRFMEEF
jgi:hypothetical protein